MLAVSPAALFFALTLIHKSVAVPPTKFPAWIEWKLATFEACTAVQFCFVSFIRHDAHTLIQLILLFRCFQHIVLYLRLTADLFNKIMLSQPLNFLKSRECCNTAKARLDADLIVCSHSTFETCFTFIGVLN